MTTVHQFRRALTTNSAATSFTAKAPTTTSKDLSPAEGLVTLGGVYGLQHKDLYLNNTNIGQKFIQLVPFGTDGNNDTFDFRLWGWSELFESDYWIPQLLIEVNVVLGNIAAGFTASTFFADTLTIAKGDTTAPVVSPANDLGASILLNLRGVAAIEFDWDLAGGQEGVSMNCLWRLHDQ